MTQKRRSRLEQFFSTINKNLNLYLARRPHRSFRRTRRRDYVRSFELPGFIGLTREVIGLLVRKWRLFGLFFIIYSVATAIILGVVNQSNYASLVAVFKGANVDFWTRTFAIFGTAITGGVNSTSTSNGQIAGVLAVLLGWLVMVWLLRNILAGRDVKLRQGLYNSGAPLIPTVIVGAIGVIQAIPLIIAAIVYSAAQNTGVLNNGVEAMMVYAVIAGLAILGLYLLTSMFIALIVVTLPGMYPLAAIKAAGDLVIGRRFRLLLRLLWLGLLVLILWAIVLFPVILLDNLIGLSWLPLVPIFVLALTTTTLILVCTYIYILYRKLVDDEAKPANR